MTEIREIHPLKKHLSEQGVVVRGWIRSRGLPENPALQCIYNGIYNADTVAKLRQEGLYQFLTEKVRGMIEAVEKVKGGSNGNT